jgi:hemerythrin
MERLTWSPALDIGNDKLNNEHQDLIALMDQIQEANATSMDKARLLDSYDRLVRATQQHFSDEEQYLASFAYPELEQHQRIHQQLLEALVRYRGEFTKSVHGRFPAAVFDFFKTWILTHIMLVDKRYATYHEGLSAKDPAT